MMLEQLLSVNMALGTASSWATISLIDRTLLERYNQSLNFPAQDYRHAIIAFIYMNQFHKATNIQPHSSNAKS